MQRYAPAPVLLLCLSTACSSSYVPAASPRASLVMDSGNWAYVRDGKKYRGGPYGGDIEEAVRGNPQAEDYARQYKGGMVWGAVLSLVGLAAVVTGAVVSTSDAAQTPSGASIPPTGLIILGSGLVIDLVGGFVALNAMPHLPDAINAYNDGLLNASPPLAPIPPGPARSPDPAVAPNGETRAF